jgi:hypothetical protein
MDKKQLRSAKAFNLGISSAVNALEALRSEYQTGSIPNSDFNELISDLLYEAENIRGYIKLYFPANHS